jgi:magnesium transporter
MITIYYYDKRLHTVEFSKRNLLKIKNKPLWIDVEKGTKEHFKILQEVFDLHSLTIEDLCYKPTHVKIEAFPNYLLVVLNGISTEEELKLKEVDFLIGKNFLISNHQSPRSAVKHMMEDPDRLAQTMKKGVDFVLHGLVDAEVDNYLPMIAKVDEQIEKLEDEAVRRPEPELLKKIIRLKKKISHIKKSSFPQREMIGILARREYKYISPRAEAYFRDVYDHALHISNTIDSQRESMNGVFDAYMSSLSNKMNEVMKMLSIIATIMLPLTFITGVYGMNFLFLPASKHPFGFWGTMIFMAALAIFMLVVFWRKKWI